MNKLIYISFILGIHSAYSQTKSANFFDDVYIGINGSGNYIHSDVKGLSNYFEDYKFEKNSKDELDFGFGINISKQILPFLNLGLEYSRGNLTGTESDEVNEGFNRYVQLKYNSIQFNSKFYLNRLFKKRLKATELNVFVVGGIGMNNANGSIFRVIEEGTSSKEFDYQTKDGLLTSLGFGLDMKMTRRTDFEVGLIKYFTSDNSLDGIDYRLNVNSANDQFYKLYFGVNVLLGNSRAVSKRWDKSYGKVNYGNRKIASKPESAPKLVSKVTKIEKRGTKTIVYADGKVKKIEPKEEIANISSYTVALKIDSSATTEGVSKEIADVELEKIVPVNIKEKEVSILAKNSQAEAVSKNIEPIQVPKFRTEDEIIEVDEKSLNEIASNVFEPNLKKNKVTEPKVDRLDRIENSTELHVVVNKNHINMVDNPRTVESVEKSKIKMNDISIVDETIVVENNIEINNEQTRLPNRLETGLSLADEVTIEEAVAIQNSYVAFINESNPSFILREDARFVSTNTKYQHKKSEKSQSPRYSISGPSASIKEELEIAEEIGVIFNANNQLAALSLNKDSGKILIGNTSKTDGQYLYFEAGLGYLTDENIEILNDYIEELNSETDLILVLEKEETSSISVNKKNSKRILKLLNYLQNKRDISASLIRVSALNSSSKSEQKKIKIYTIQKD